MLSSEGHLSAHRLGWKMRISQLALKKVCFFFLMLFRFTSERQGPGGQHYYHDYRGHNEHRGGYRPDPHRSNHYRSEYGNHYREQSGQQQQHYGHERSTDEWAPNRYEQII